jgi:hypothetical protein
MIAMIDLPEYASNIMRVVAISMLVTAVAIIVIGVIADWLTDR